MGPNIKKPVKVFLKTRVVICPGLMLLSWVVNVLQSSDQEQKCVYIKNEKTKQGLQKTPAELCKNVCFCNVISSLRKTVNDSVLMEGQMEPLPSQNNFVQYVKVTEVHLGIPEHLLISVSWTNEKEVVFLVFFFFLIINTNTHKSLCKEESTLALNP